MSGDAHGHHELGFFSKYVFSRDHKIIGIQFLFTTLIFLGLGGLLALGVRWQLAFPWKQIPFIGERLFASTGGQMPPEFYTSLVTMHATVMIFFVVIPILAGAFGNYVIPLQIGARDMAFPTLNMLSYWFFWPAIYCLIRSFFSIGGAPAAGWTGYPPLAAIAEAAPGSREAQTWWLAALVFIGLSSLMGSLNYITTIVKCRAPGMTFLRMPMTTWSMFITAILQAFALPVLTVALIIALLDRTVGTTFFTPPHLWVNNVDQGAGGGQPLLWQHLFWFYSHPAVYIMILPAMGIVSDVIATFSRKPLFGYRPMIYSISAIAGLGFVVWGHHMFQSGMNPALGATFMVSTMLIALPSAVKVFNWTATLWRANIRFTAPMLCAVAFVSMFIIGGLSGIFMAATPVDIHIHDTYFIVAHIHYVLFTGSLMGMFAGVQYWFPKMFGRMMSDYWGRVHFALTFILMNVVFFPMHQIGLTGFPRRYADPYHSPLFAHLKDINQIITMAAIALGLTQLIFIANLLLSLFWGKKAGDNPWESGSLEWASVSPPPHGNWGEKLPVVHRGPYEYSAPEAAGDFQLQTQEPVK